MESPTSATAIAIAFATIFVTCFFLSRRKKEAPKVIGGLGTQLHRILTTMPSLQELPTTPWGMPGMVQLAVFTVQILLEEIFFEATYDTEREQVEVTIPGDSTDGCTDRVNCVWIKGRKHRPKRELSEDAPIVILLPGLNCYAASLPGTSMYKALLKKPWRIAVFEKRGVGTPNAPGLNAPAFHLFGHPSDLHQVVTIICGRYPKAPIHLVGLSSGNGLAGSYTALYGSQVPALRSSLLLIGGEDYNLAFAPPTGDWRTKLVFDQVLLETTKNRFLRRSEKVLRAHSEVGYAACLAAQTLQELYNLSTTYFSGYSDRAEAERRLNAFSGSNEVLLKSPVPFLVVYTEDDPVAPGGPRQEWVGVMKRCEKAALALFPSGSHLGCYDSPLLSRWVEKLAVDWVEASTSPVA
eukprot:CAMPEP_0206423480 /NCGR_PEP_ID=MMETSP0324_2-20121206/2703_1 /ASSEMBLY_ACC=CAM_ASM_000836 /TAXON_ID=2866 /ORGANISM="Crypthecodinium cohnii, Strain Seligo" /LENGTH=408 /DNA_ID=CAMNT_0053888043 /DNA_START=40 /DNA_END=1266 /DNA_ORIENTATION=+